MDEFDINLIERYKTQGFYNAEIDKYKKRLLIYNSFSKTNSFEFNPQTMFLYVSSDVYNRYYKMNGYNTLYLAGLNNLSFSSFLFSKNQKKDYTDISSYLDSLDKLGISYDSNYFMSLSNNSFIYQEDMFFNKYFNKYIFLTNGIVYTNKAKNRYYNEFEIDNIFNKYYSKYTKEELIQTETDYFYLDISSIESKIREKINNLNIDITYKKELLQYLGDYHNISLPFVLNNKEVLNIELDEPELMAGISFISLNPKYIDVSKYISEEEYPYVYKYMQNGYNEGKFSGLIAKNPFNGEDIIIIISYNYDEAIHVGIPDFREEDLEFNNLFGLDYKKVLNNNKLINSDFLNDLSKEEARNKIIEEYTSEDFGILIEHFRNTKIIISQPDETGSPIPFEIINDGFDYKIVDEKYYPLKFNRFNKVLYGKEPEYNIDLINLTFNNFYQTSILKNYIVKNNYIENKDFASDKLELIYKEELSYEILGPIIFSIIDNIDLKNSNYIVYKDIYPNSEEIITNNNLNIKFVSDTLDKYSPDAVRVYSLKHPSDNNLDEILFKISKIDLFLADVYMKYQEEFGEEDSEIDNDINELKKELNNYLLNNKLDLYCARLEYSFNNLFKNKKWTEDNALTYLKLMSIVCPFISEKIFEDRYNLKNILFEEWPKI